MKFFKYLIFIFFLTISFNSYSATYVISGSFSSSSYESACQSYVADRQSKNTNSTFEWKYDSAKESICYFRQFNISSQSLGPLNSVPIVKTDQKCETGKTKEFEFYSSSMDSNPPSSFCSGGCSYKDAGGVSTTMGTTNGNFVTAFDGQTTGETCSADTDLGSDTPNNNQMKPEECKSPTGSDAYCKKPTDKKCPTGYKQGSFNNEQICIKPSPDLDPDKPNPNDPNNGKGEGSCNGTNNCNTTNFDDSGIISAINSMKSALSSAISSLSSAISSMSSTLSSAINANGDKVTNAVNTNGKNTVDAVNANGVKVTNAVNTNGKNTVDAVNKGTEATKENGEKLDGIKDSIDEGNGILEEIKDWLTDKLPEKEGGTVEVKTIDITENNNAISFSAVCPAPISQNTSIMGHSWTYTFSFDSYCTVLQRLSSWFVFSAWLAAAFIIAGVRDA